MSEFELINAAWNRDIRWARRILKDVPDPGHAVNTQNHIGCTALMAASQRSDIEITQLLLASGADPNIKCYLRGASALHHAVKHQKLDNIEILVAHGADVNSRTKSGETPLFWAHNFADNVGDSIRMLVRLGADVDAIDQQDRTLLDRAIMDGRIGCVRALIESGANVNRTRAFGGGNTETPLYSALLNRDAAMVRVLLHSGASVDATVRKKSKQFTMLNTATWLRFSEGVKLLLQYGDKNAAVEDDQGHSPLGIAVSNCYHDIVLMLTDSIVKQSSDDLINLCVLLRPLGLPVLVVLEIFKQERALHKQLSPMCTISLAKQWYIAAKLKR